MCVDGSGAVSVVVAGRGVSCVPSRGVMLPAFLVVRVTSHADDERVRANRASYVSSRRNIGARRDALELTGVAVAGTNAMARKITIPLARRRTPTRLDAKALTGRWRDDALADPEADPPEPLACAEAAHDHFVAVLEKAALFSAGQRDRLLSSRGQLEEAAQ